MRDWYEHAKYVRYVGKNREVITIQRRKTDWAKYVTEYHNLLVYESAGIIRTEIYEGIELGFISGLYDFRQKKLEMAKRGEIGYRVPGRYKR